MKHCKRCGVCCCDLLPVSTDEIERIREYIGRHPRILRKQPQNIRECPFLRKRLWYTRCAIYRVRPVVCRTYDCTRPVDEIVQAWKDQECIRAPQSMYAAVYGMYTEQKNLLFHRSP